MRTNFYSRLLLLLVAIVSIPIFSCTDQKEEEFKEIEAAISYRRALTPEDMTNALRAARKIEYYSYTTPGNPIPYPKKVEQVMLDYLAEQGGVGIKANYAQLMNSAPMKTAEAYFAHELYSNARIEPGDLTLVNQMMDQAGLSANAKAVMNKMYYDLEASGEALLLEAEANAVLGSSTNTSEIKSRFRKLLLPYRDKIYSNPTLTTKDKQLIHNMAAYVLDQLSSRSK